MGRKGKSWTVDAVRERLAQNFGQGVGRDYKPWIGLRDFSSRGVTTRTPSWKLNRTVLTLSLIERNALLVAQFHANFLDYWEQRPIPRQESLDIAKRLKVSHPMSVGKNPIPLVMNLDGVLSTITPDGVIQRFVLDCKLARDLQKRRVAEKLAIHREYAKEMGWGYRLYTELSFSPNVISNLIWLDDAEESEDECTPATQPLEALSMQLLEAVRYAANGRNALTPVRQFCQAWEAVVGQPAGVGLRCLRILIQRHRIDFDLEVSHLVMLRSPLRELTFLPSI